MSAMKPFYAFLVALALFATPAAAQPKPPPGEPAIAVLMTRAAAGDVDAAYDLGDRYMFGTGGATRDLGESMRWMLVAAEGGVVAAQQAVADLYVDADGPRGQDLAAALFWYTRAAGAGDGAAQYDLGIMYALGEGVPVNNVEAYYWLALSAMTGAADNAVAARDVVAAALSPKERGAADVRVAAFQPVR